MIMKAVQIVKPNELKLIDMEKPVITEKDNVLVKMTAAGICGSDVASTTEPTQPQPTQGSSGMRWLAAWMRWVPM